MTHENHHHFALHLGFEIAKLALRGAAVTAAYLIAQNIYKVHKSIEAHKK